MDLLYRALGIAAAVNHFLWRRRINFIPLNLVLIGTATAICYMAVSDWEEALRNGREPLVRPLAQLEQRPPSKTFITTSGTLIPDDGYAFGERDDQGRVVNPTMQFLPLIDPQSKRGVLVRVFPPHRFATRQPAEITGILDELHPYVLRELDAIGARQGVTLLPGLYLADGDAPEDPQSSKITVAITAPILVLFAILTLRRNVFFRRGLDPDPAWHTPGAGGSLHATGTFHLGKYRKHFIKIPAALGTLETGELAVFANVDASSDFMGATYLKRAGIWILPLAPGSLRNVEEGTLYFGTRPLPSLRFHYRDAITQKEKTAILSTPDGAIYELATALASGSADAWPTGDPRDALPQVQTSSSHPHLGI